MPSFINESVGRGKISGSMNFAPPPKFFPFFFQNLIVKGKRRVRFGTTGIADWLKMLILPFYLVVFQKKIDYHPNFPHRKQNSTKFDFVQLTFAKSRKLILDYFTRTEFVLWVG